MNGLENVLVPIFGITVPMFFTYKIIELAVCRKERMAMIEKLSSSVDLGELKNNLSLPLFKKLNSSWSIRFGLLLVGLGIGISIASLIELCIKGSATQEYYAYIESAISNLYLALAALFGGIGLVAAYFMEKRKERDENFK